MFLFRKVTILNIIISREVILMSKADQIFINNMKDIMENGFWDTDLNVRPHWEDGTPAHTVKKFCIVNRYNLQEETVVCA